MKTEDKTRASLLPVIILITVLCLTQTAFSQVEILGDWVLGLTHAKEAGQDRALILFVHAENNGPVYMDSVTYGGQPMTLINEYNAGTPEAQAYVAAFILDEAGIAAATNSTFQLQWNPSPLEQTKCSVFFSNVDQTTLTGASGEDGGIAGSVANPISTDPLSTKYGDMVIGSAMCGYSGDYTPNNGFIEGYERDMPSSVCASIYKSATGFDETPSVLYVGDMLNRQVIIGFVVNVKSDPSKASDPSPTNGESNVSVSTNLSWDAPAEFIPTSYDVYFGTNPTAHSNPKNTVYTNSYVPPDGLEFGITYYWVVDSNDNGTIYTGDTWSFTTIENKVTNPNPDDGETNISTTTNLSWSDAASATSYDVYFGIDTDVYSNSKYTVYTNSFDPPGDLEIGTTYHWVVDSNDDGTIYQGYPWNFTTIKLHDRVVGNMILMNDNGGWCWYQDEKIAYDPVGGNILTSTAACYVGFGGVNGSRSNDMDTTTFNIATGKRTRVVAKEGFGGDDHNMGAFWIRPDGRYLHIYCSHYNDPQVSYLRLADYPNDGSSWGTEYTYNWETISGLTDTQSSSYTNVVYLSDEGTGSGRLYNIIRVFNRTPCISYSDDWGVTWNYMGRLNDVTVTGYSNFYHKFASKGVDRIDFIGCEAHPRDYDDNSIYHGYIQGGISYDSYGNQVDVINDQDAPPIGEFTPVWLSEPLAADSYHTGWSNELELDDQGYPVCLFQTRYGLDSYGGEPGATDHRFFYGRFDGSDWNITELAKMGTGLHVPEEDYLGMGCIHPDDVNTIYIATQFDPRDDSENTYREIFKGVTYDYGETWNWTQITFDSTQNNTRPAIPKWNANNTAVVWTRGNWNQDSYEQYDLVVVGIVDEQDATLGLVNYIDATESNTEESDGSDFTPTGPSGSAGAADNLWHEYTGYGNGGSCYTAGDGGTENAPTIRTTVTGLSAGTYDVFAYFWCDPDLDWGVRGGFTSSDMLCFSKQSSQSTDESQFSSTVEVMNDTFLLYRVYIGREQVTGGASVTVYIDDYDDSYNSNAPARTTYDGIGIAPVLTGPVYNPGDLSQDGRVDLVDIAVLGQDWQTIYGIDTLAEIAGHWLVVYY